MFYRRFRPLVSDVCAGFLPPAEVDEAAHDVLVKASRAFDRFDLRRRISPWLRRVARNHCLDLLKAPARSRAMRLSSVPVNEHPSGCVEEAALDRLETVRRVEGVRGAVAALSDRQRRVIEEHHLRGRTYSEVARGMGLSEHAVRNLAHRARAALRRALEHLGTIVPLPLLLASVRRRSAEQRAKLQGALDRLGLQDGSVAMLGQAVAMLALVAAIGSAVGLPPAGPRDDRALSSAPSARTASRTGFDEVAGPTRATSPDAGDIDERIRVQEEHEWRDGAALPKRGELGVEVYGPDGERLFWTETHHSCEEDDWDRFLPSDGPIKATC